MSSFTFDSDIKELKESFQANGFVIVRNVFEQTDFHQLKDSMDYIFRERFSKNQIVNDTTWSEDEPIRGGLPHKALNELYSNNKNDFRNCWDVIRLLPELFQFSFCQKTNKLLAAIGIEKPSLENFPVMRIDMPRDDNRNIPWHQEWRYGFGSLNSASFWVPLTNVTAEMGTLRILPKSHLKGLIKVHPVDKIHNYEIEDYLLSEFDPLEVEINYGDLVLFSNFIVHESGNNISELCRYSIQMRFNDLTCPYFQEQGWPRSFIIKNNYDLIFNEKSTDEVSFKSY